MKKVLTLLTLLMAFAINGFAQDTWTVAGTAAALNGTQDWAPANADNDMTLVGEEYVLVVENVTLEKGVTYQYKVVKNHAWDEAYPTSNKTFKIQETATYKVTYKFDPNTKAVDEVIEKTGEAGVVTHAYSIAGSPESVFGAAWSETATATEMTLTDGLYTWTSEEVELEANTAIAFKVVVDHSWGVAYPSDNYVLNIEAAGKYTITITFNEETKEVNATATKVEEQPALNTYTATFTTNAKWEKAYAYAWSGEGESAVKFLGDWPGTPLEATDGVYTVTISAAAAPEKIIFNNGKSEDFVKQQTEDLDFEDGKAYTFTVPSPAFEDGSYYIQNIANGLFLAAGQDFAGAEGTLFGFTFDESLGAYSITGNEFFAWDNKKWYVVGDATSFKAYYILNNKKYYLALSERNGWVVYDEGNELMTDDNSTWCIKPKTTEPVITSMAIVGDLTGGWPVKDEVSGEEDWSMAKAMTQDAENPAVWTLTIEGFEAEAKIYEYKATANGKWGDFELPNPGNLEIEFGTELNPVGKYNLTFVVNTDDGTLALTPVKVEEQPALNTYTATFTTNAKWEKAYAYAWSGEGESAVKFLGDWPGTPLEATDGVYTVTISAAAAPEKIIFNNGKSEDFVKQQTEDLDFEDGKAYTFTVPSPAFEDGSYYIQNIANGLFLAAGQDFAGAEGTLFGFTFDESLGAYSITGNEFFAWDNKKWYVVGDATSFKAYYILNNKKYYLALSERNGWVVYDEGNELMTDDNSTWCIKPKTTEPVITSMAIVGDLTGGWPTEDDWSMAKAMTQDAENPAVWTLTIEGFEAEAKIYEYKATANGKWGDFELPNPGNLEIEFGTELNPVGKYNLTFVVNTDDGTLALTPVKAETTEPVVISSMAIVGELTGGWPTEEDWSMAKAMTQSADNTAIWTLTVEGFEAEAKTYKYKATANGKWGDYELPASGDQEFTFGTEEYPAGKYNLTFTANTVENTLTLTPVKAEEQPVLNTYTATFTNEAGWEKVYAYAFTNAGDGNVTEFLGAWPGTELTAGEGGIYAVTIQAAAAPAFIIFNNGITDDEGKAQTADLAFEDKGEYTNKVEEQPVLNTYTVTFTNEAGWEKVYAYAWTTTLEGEVPVTNEFLGEWPGKELTAGEDGKFVVTIVAEAAPAFIIFNNGAGTQTEDLAFEDGKTYTYEIPVEPVNHTWDFTQWSDETVDNLKADAATSKLEGWSDVEKKADAEADVAPTDISKDNCFWYVGGEANPTANGVAIKELKGLEFNTSYGAARSLAIAVNYPETSLGSYKGGAYLWLGGKGKECFTIKNVKVGSTLTIGAESHNPAQGRGIQLKINGENFGDAFTPTTFAENSWTITSTDESVKVVDVVVTNTNGCHLYYIDVDIVEVPVADGYYLAGSMNNWVPTEADALQENTEAAGEYMKTLDMTAQTEIKVVKVENLAIAAWYPAEGANYVISEDANYTVYFRPDGNTEWENGFFFVQKNDATGIAALKALQENGAAVYNLSGQRISVAKKGLYIVNGRKVVVK